MVTAITIDVVPTKETDVLGALTLFFRESILRPEKLAGATFEELGNKYRCSKAWATNIHNGKGTVGKDLEATISELHYGGSVDALRREAVQYAQSHGWTVRDADLYDTPYEGSDDYPSRQVAIRAARFQFEQAVRELQTLRLKAPRGDKDIDPGAGWWELKLDELVAAEKRRAANPGLRIREEKLAKEDMTKAIHTVARARLPPKV